MQLTPGFVPKWGRESLFLPAPRSFGPYTLLERISVGGMAEVFKAVRNGSKQPVALKKILPGVAADEEFLELFQDEARIASQLEHRNIARILDFGEAASSHYIALEYIDGMPLRTLIDRTAARDERIPIEIAVHVVAEVANGLAYAHDRKNAQGQPLHIVHRDVSPQNILLSFTGQTKLIDFGIAKAAGKITRTQAGAIKGKVGYMSPEQLRGSGIDRRSDIFGLGICLWETLTQRRLFDGPNELVIMEQIRSARIVPPSSSNPRVDPELDRICLKALAKDPKERYATASEFEADLRAFARSLPATGDAPRVAAFMGRMFPSEAARYAATGHDHEESNRMSEKGGSDLDVFDGLAKKSQPRPSVPSQRGPAPPPPASRQKTLLGLAAPNVPPPPSGRKSVPGRPPPSGPPPATVRGAPAPPATRSAPVPPRSRTGSLPAPAPPPSRGPGPTPSRGPAPPPSRGGAPPPASRASGPPAPAPLPKPPPAAAAPVDMDWDDEDEKTSVFDKAGGEHSATALLRSAPPPAPAAGTPAPNSARLGGAAALVTGSGGAAPSMPRPPEPAPQAPQPQQAPGQSPGYSPQVVAASLPAPPSSTGRTIALAFIGLLVVGLIAAVVLLVLPSKGSLVVTVAGPGNKAVDAVEVFVDGAKRCGTSPCRVSGLKTGTHMVKVVAAGYEQTADQAVAVEKNTEAVLNVTLSRASEGTGIKVKAEGSGLRLSVDGKDVGPLPQELKDMTPGDHTIKIGGSDRYKPFEKHVTVTPDEMQTIEPKLKVVKGLARIVPGNGAKGAKVLLVSGHERRPIPKLPIKIDIQTEKSWSIIATRKGYEEFKQDITFEDGKAERTFKIDMVEKGSAPAHHGGHVATSTSHHGTTTHHEEHGGSAPAGKGKININSIPVSSVILDGRPLGTTPKVGVSVSPGSHTVVFVHPEYGRKVRSVSVSAGGTATAAVRFP